MRGISPSFHFQTIHMKNATLVYKSSDYAHLPRTVISSTDEPICYFTGKKESLEDIIIKKYISLLFMQRQKLDNASLFLYGKRSEVPENQTRTAFLQLAQLENRAKKSIQGISSEIRSCVGKEMLFFHKKNPITISQIMSAYRAICINASKQDVWHHLVN